VCAENGDLETARLLLDSGATRTINEWGGLSGYTALGYAAQRLNVPMIRALLEAGADPEVRDLDSGTARDRIPARPPSPSDEREWEEARRLLKVP
jgi:ankyrin repeat protein